MQEVHLFPVQVASFLRPGHRRVRKIPADERFLFDNIQTECYFLLTVKGGIK